MVNSNIDAELALVALKRKGWIENEQGCWIHQARQTRPGGYTQIGINKRLYVSSRLAYMAWHGLIPDDMRVCHRCDNPPCVRPSHLFLGTMQDNSDDMYRKGRRKMKVTPEMVGQIKALHDAGVPYSKIGPQFGISGSQAHRVATGDNWPDRLVELRT